MINKIIMTAIGLVAISSVSSAQTVAFQSLAQERDPASVAKAGAVMTSSENIAFAAYNNPAAVPFSEEKFNVMAATTMSLSSSSAVKPAFTGAVAGNIKNKFGVAFAANYLAGSEYDVIDDFGNRTGKFKTSSMDLALGLGFKVAKNFSLGVNARYASETLAADYKSNVFACDAYAMYKWKWLSVVAGVSNLGTDVESVTGQKFPIPSSAKVAVGYSTVSDSDHSVSAELDVDYFFSGAFGCALGAEYSFRKMVFARGGYCYNTGVLPSYASVGAGVRVWGISLDVACMMGNPVLKNALTVGLGYRF